MKMIIGQKLGMTRIFDAEGKSVPVSLVKILPCTVSQVKTEKVDGYNAIAITAKNPLRDDKVLKIAEFKVENIEDYKKGQKILSDQFEAGDIVEVTGTSKGKGFAGTIKRHSFKRGPEGHGGNNVREPGSIGAQQPQRVVLGRKMAGHMGAVTVNVKNLKVVDVDKDTIAISGAIPGPAKGILKIWGKSKPTVTSTEE